MKIAIRRARSLRQRWRFVIIADNGEPLAQSELYSRRIDAIDTANRLASATFTVRDETSMT